jgi:DNA-binding response OmpR family regulator
MSHDHAAESCHVLDVVHPDRPISFRLRAADENGVVNPWSYRAKLGRGTILLSPVEFRILSFLAASPYRAFTRRRIAEAVSTESQPVTEDTLSDYIQSLRDQLGFYGDLIQSVPFIGYRFKA